MTVTVCLDRRRGRQAGKLAADLQAYAISDISGLHRLLNAFLIWHVEESTEGRVLHAKASENRRVTLESAAARIVAHVEQADGF